jgi:hypothetical protein
VNAALVIDAPDAPLTHAASAAVIAMTAAATIVARRRRLPEFFT